MAKNCVEQIDLLKKKSTLVWDMFKAHLVDSVQEQLKKKKTELAVIPGGCTTAAIGCMPEQNFYVVKFRNYGITG